MNKYLITILSFILIQCNSDSSSTIIQDSNSFSATISIDYHDWAKNDPLLFKVEYTSNIPNDLNLKVISNDESQNFTLVQADSLTTYEERFLFPNSESLSFNFYNGKNLIFSQEFLFQIPDFKVLLVDENILNDNMLNQTIKNNLIFKNSDKISIAEFGETSLSGYELILFSNIGFLTQNEIEKIQQFLLNGKKVFFILNEKIIRNKDWKFYFNFPLISSVRGASSNQFFNADVNTEFFSHSLGLDSIKDLKVFRYFELSPNQDFYSLINLKNQNTLLFYSEVLTGEVYFFNSSIDSNWTNNISYEIIFDILVEIALREKSLNE